jgi:hypothetical protein
MAAAIILFMEMEYTIAPPFAQSADARFLAGAIFSGQGRLWDEFHLQSGGFPAIQPNARCGPSPGGEAYGIN